MSDANEDESAPGRRRLLREYAEHLYGSADFFAGVLDGRGAVVYANDEALCLADASLDDVTGTPFWETPWANYDADARRVARDRVDGALAGDRQRYEGHYPDADDGVTVEMDLRPLTEPDSGDVFAVAVTGVDVTRREDLETAHEANLLALEGVYNTIADESLSFEDRVEALLSVGRERLGLNEAFYTKIDGGTQMIQLSMGDHPLLQEGEQAPLADSYCKRTITDDGGQFAINDAGNTDFADDSGYDVFGLEAYVGSEVRVEDATHGTICFADTAVRETAIEETEQAFVNLLAEWLSNELEHRRRERSLEQQAERLDRFASVVTHDLRAPLSVAEGRLDLASSRLHDEHEAKAGIEDARTALSRMDELIAALRDLAREGEVVGDPEPVSLSDVADAAVDTALPETATLQTDDSAGAVLHADPERLQTVFENLFTNAVQHGGEDVTVTVASTDAKSGGGSAGFYVADDGPGFDTPDPNVVFDEGYTTREDGTGYGLSIVEAIAEAHGWTIAASESDAGGARLDVRGVEFDPEL